MIKNKTDRSWFEQRSIIKFSWLRCPNQMKFTEECVICLKRKATPGVETHGLSRNEQVKGTVVSKEFYPENLLRYERTRHYWYLWKCPQINSLNLMNDAYMWFFFQKRTLNADLSLYIYIFISLVILLKYPSLFSNIFPILKFLDTFY